MADLNKIVSEQANIMGIRSVPLVEEETGNASTDGKAVFVNPQFMSKIESSGGEGGVRFVIAHELGHIAAGMGGGPQAELDADQLAARSVAAAGVNRSSIQAVMTHLPDESTDSHPGAGAREAVALQAYQQERRSHEDEDRSSKKKKLHTEKEHAT